jgi:hypothetical protein
VGQLGDELLHRLADPPRCVRPERDAAFGVVALERAQEPDDALLEELRPLDGGVGTFGELLADPLAEGEYERVLDAVDGAELRALLAGLSARAARAPIAGRGTPRALSSRRTRLASPRAFLRVRRRARKDLTRASHVLFPGSDPKSTITAEEV